MGQIMQTQALQTYRSNDGPRPLTTSAPPKISTNRSTTSSSSTASTSPNVPSLPHRAPISSLASVKHASSNFQSLRDHSRGPSVSITSGASGCRKDDGAGEGVLGVCCPRFRNVVVVVGGSSSDSASLSSSGSVIDGLLAVTTRPSTTTPNERRTERAGDEDLETPALVRSARRAFRISDSTERGERRRLRAIFVTRSQSCYTSGKDKRRGAKDL